MKWPHPFLWPLKLEFGWLFPKSERQKLCEDLAREYYNRSHTFEEKEALRKRIIDEFPDFFTSEHFQH
jgi:hypothetical protein